MKISYHWLQKYFDEKLPAPLELADVITMRSSEVDGVEAVGDDTVIDIKILPDRAHYALSHKGIAYEVAAITGLKQRSVQPYVYTQGHTVDVFVTNTAPELCRRYTACLVENISVGDSASDIEKFLEAIGSRSINSIVDAANVTMFDVGQPLHAFDADKVQGGITIRLAENGEKITVLDGREIELDHTVLVIADELGAIAIAGVKGGKRAEVTRETKRIIIESANFDPTTVRRTSTRLNLRNDSSKRFENEITPELTLEGINHILKQITVHNPEAQIGPIVDIYPQKAVQNSITVSKNQIDTMLGITIPVSEFETILTRLDIAFTARGDMYTLTVPYERLDITIAADVAEEVGRLYGYDKLPNTSIESIQFTPTVEPAYYLSEKIKNTLQDLGFSEIITQTLGKKGDLEVAYPVAKDRGFLRTTLRTRAEDALEHNGHYAALLGLSAISIFEIGKVFVKESETLQLVIAHRAMVKPKKGTQPVLERVLETLKATVGTELPIIEKTPELVIIDLDTLVKKSVVPKDYEGSIRLDNKSVIYTKISPYPYIVRDIAVFVPTTVLQTELETIIDTHATKLMVRRDLFDVFTKKLETGEEKTSYAFRIVFQSMEKTLTDDEVNVIMQKITEVMHAQVGWQVR